MRIHMNTLAAGPAGIFQGDCECPDEEARRYIAGGYAIPLGGVIETAMLAPAKAVSAMVETRNETPVTEVPATPENPGDLVPNFGKYHNGEYKDKPLTLGQIKAQDPEYLEYLANKQQKDPMIAAAAKAVLAGA